MDLGIAKKRALVTGATHGIGRAASLALAREGCRVAAVARGKAELDRLLADLGGEPAGHRRCSADLLETGAPASVVRALAADGGDFDIVVHCVGGTLEAKDPLAPAQAWESVWRLNAGIAIELNALLAPAMRRNRWGRIIHVSSLAAQNLKGSAPYAAAKAYLNAYARLLGDTLAKDGIAVSAVMPGAVLVPGGNWDESAERNRKDPESFRRKKEDFLRHHQPIGRLAAPEEIANVIVFLASEQAVFTAGSVVQVSGGGS